MKSLLPSSLAGLLLVLLLTTLAATRAAASTGLEEAVTAIANEAVTSGSAVGLSIGIARGDEILLAKGYGVADVELAVPATKETVHRIGSITKQFTAAAILLLVEEKKLSLDDPITRFLPDYPVGEHKITIRHLLQHTSGIKSFTSLPSYRKQIRTDTSHEEIINRFKDTPPNFAPGEKFRYCNSGYYLLGVIVEKVSEKSYAEFLQERIFQPLDLKHTVYDKHARIIPNRASGYARGRGGPRNAPYVSMTQPFAAGALVSTAEDLIAWQRGLVSGKLLSADTHKLMTTPGKLNDGKPINYGLGVFIRKVDGHQAVRHGGGINGFRSDLVYYPDIDCTIAVLANSESTNPAKLSDRIAKHLFGAAEKKCKPDGKDKTKACAK